MSSLAEQARIIWQAAVDAVKPGPLVRAALSRPEIVNAVALARRILVFGGGKAGAAMSAALEDALAGQLEKVEGLLNVPAGALPNLRKIQLHVARPSGTNQPTAAGIAGVEVILRLASSAQPQDVGLCLLSGGGSALLPAPAMGVTLADKQTVTSLLHACGATINEMNAVRKHLSAIKGGRLAQAWTGGPLFSLIISDVVGDPLDVIASGPTAPDPTTFADALAVFEKYGIVDRVPPGVLAHLRRGERGEVAETPKTLPENVHNLVIGNNAMALAAAEAKAGDLGWPVLNLGPALEGETRTVAVAQAELVRRIRATGSPKPAPVCILSGGETTVTLGPDHGKGGRNQEFVLAALLELGREGMREAAVLSGGTDGEDGPTDAAGAWADETSFHKLPAHPADYLVRNDAYSLFTRTGTLLKTGLTQTNVMDVRVILVGPAGAV